MNRKILVFLFIILLLSSMIITSYAADASVNDVNASRGDTVIFNATLSGSETVGMGGVALSYDSSVLELASGTCEVSGTMLTNFDINTGLGAFMFAGTGTVGGTLFTATFKVKDDAPFGTTSVSMDITLKDGSNADISVFNSSGSITVVCNHDFTAMVASDKYLVSEASCTQKAAYHYSCAGCGEMGTATFEYGTTKAHSYMDKIADVYLKSAETCTANAVYYKSCSVCEAKGSDTFEAAGSPSHNYQTVWSNDSTSHWHECSKCQDKKDVALHIAGNAATETTAQKCTVCGYVITPALGHTHKYSAEWTSNANEHWHSCVGCSSVKDTEACSYTNACDAECNICGYKREIAHSYKTEWMSDAEQHWYECSICRDRTNVSAHTPGAAATETTAHTCTICGYVIQDALGHTHNFDTVKKDDANHWNECVCGEKSGVSAHVWDDGVITKEATYTAEGERTYTCTTCGITKAEVVDKLVKIEEIIAGDNSDVKVVTPAGSTAILDENIELKVEKVTEKISNEVIANIAVAVSDGDKTEVLASYDISLILDGVAVQPGGVVEVTLPAPENAEEYDALQVVFVDDDGSVTPCETRVNADGTVTFVTDHFSYYAIVGVQDAASMAWLWIVIIGIVVLAGAIVTVIVIKKKRA